MTPRKRRSSVPATGQPGRGSVGVRIIGGRFRGRKLLYYGDPRVRPMKDRLREAIFNRIGPAIAGKHAIDLFAGTGALGLEAISRDAARATLIEQHFPTAEIIRQNVAALGVEQITRIVTSDVFVWQKRRPDLGPWPWVVFCSPPYDFYAERTAQMLELIGGLIESAPAESLFVVESDGRFDFALLPEAETWDVRSYPPAVVGIHFRPR
jgi:16S rRNA (guanine966-N2)-methyltransferase